MTSARVKFNYEPQLEDELPLTKGEIIKILEKSTDGWWKGEVNGQAGWFPGTYVEEIEGVENREQELVPPKIIKTPPTPAAANKPQKDPNAGRPVLETVIALWEFQGGMPEEISFSKGEHLDIIEKPQNDPEWWLARNSEGKSGLIPQNYVQSVNAVAEEMADAWNFGQISRDDAERTLRLGKEGDFLVRDSESTKGDYSISVKTDSKLIRHFRIENKHGKLVIGGKTFINIPDLIEHYTSHAIFIEGPEKLFLVQPAQR